MSVEPQPKRFLEWCTSKSHPWNPTLGFLQHVRWIMTETNADSCYLSVCTFGNLFTRWIGQMRERDRQQQRTQRMAWAVWKKETAATLQGFLREMRLFGKFSQTQLFLSKGACGSVFIHYCDCFIPLCLCDLYSFEQKNSCRPRLAEGIFRAHRLMIQTLQII